MITSHMRQRSLEGGPISSQIYIFEPYFDNENNSCCWIHRKDIDWKKFKKGMKEEVK